MRFKLKVSRVVVSLIFACAAFFSFSLPASAAYGDCNYGSAGYDTSSCTTTSTDDGTLTDTGDSSLYIGIGAVVLSVAALVIILRKKKSHHPDPVTKTDL